LPGVEWRIEAEVLQLRSPFLADSGWYVTEDRVRADAAGGFALLGRADRIAKIEERRVSLSAIERSLLESPLVAEARVLVLVRDSAARTAAVVVPSDAGSALLQAQGRRVMSDALRAAIASSIERVAWPRQWRYVTALPVNTQGKVTEADLQRLFDDHEPDGVRWLEQGPAQARVELVANQGHAAFAGHFPAAAILPGVVQLDWAINLARQAFAIEAPVCRLEVLKFQAPVLPGLVLAATLEWDQALMRLTFQYQSSQGRHASGRVIFGQLNV
jgi:3-hydroxymyristoyl/3-hydroxydecanoyl-(acyl carrier protein) dehydratase